MLFVFVSLVAVGVDVVFIFKCAGSSEQFSFMHFVSYTVLVALTCVFFAFGCILVLI